MTKEELKDEYAERAKIFQEAMESCKSSNSVDCIEWFADKIIELEKACDETQKLLESQIEATYKVVEENAELKAQIEKMKDCLNKWYSQHNDDGYTETFYDSLLRDTEKYLLGDSEND